MHWTPGGYNVLLVATKTSSIIFDEAFPIGIGRLTTIAHSTSATPGILVAGNRGLFHFEDISGKATRVRKNPVGWLISGKNAVVVYEEVAGKGNLAVLDGDLKEIFSDQALARSLNVKAVHEKSLLLYDHFELHIMNIRSAERREIAKIEPVRRFGPFSRSGDAFEFIAIHRDKNWTPVLYSLSQNTSGSWILDGVAECEDKFVPHHFIALPNGDYLIVNSTRPALWIYRIYPGDEPRMRSREMVPVPADGHPVGVLWSKEGIIAAVHDSLLRFKWTDPHQ